jgi:hypothetical protein
VIRLLGVGPSEVSILVVTCEDRIGGSKAKSVEKFMGGDGDEVFVLRARKRSGVVLKVNSRGRRRTEVPVRAPVVVELDVGNGGRKLFGRFPSITWPFTTLTAA